MHKGISMDQLKPQKDEVTVDKIVEACEQFISLAGLPKPKGVIPGVSRRTRNQVKNRIYSVFYEPVYMLSVRADSGKIQTFTNMGREFEYSHGKKQKPPFVLTDPINAKGYVNRLYKKLGFGGRYRISRFDCNLNGDKNNNELGYVGFVRIDLEAYEFGYPLAVYDRSDIAVDPLDGALIGYGVTRTNYKIESHASKLTFDQAKKKAETTVKQYGVGTYRQGMAIMVRGARIGDRLWPPKRLSRQEYVCPNGLFGGLKYDEKESPKRLRLAWVLYYPGDEAVFVDAGDGRILGGISKVWK